MKRETAYDKNSKIMMILLVVVAVVGIASATYFYFQWQQATKSSSSSQISKQQAQALKDKVSKLMSLPDDEEPVVATVEDAEKLKNQPFFKNAVKGDRILMFPKAKKAILYRESDNKLINVGPIAITSQKTDKKNN